MVSIVRVVVARPCSLSLCRRSYVLLSPGEPVIECAPPRA
jgi:hypothetical protein